MEPLVLSIFSCDNYKYGEIKLENDKITHGDYFPKTTRHKTCKQTYKLRWNLDCVFLHYFVKELTLSDFYRRQFVLNVRKWNFVPNILVLKPTKVDLIDYNWNDRVYYLVRERCELDHALSWLSTLGGAFSALGDYFEKCADTAGKISVHQLKLALRLKDPNIASRCRLYLSLSLIQKKKFRLASRIVRNEYNRTKRENVVDDRLVKMCNGIWSKLQYEHELYRNNINKKIVER